MKTTRRGLLMAATWAAPAVTVAAAAPAFATSTVAPRPPVLAVGCADTPGKHAKTVRLFVRLTPRPAGAVVRIGQQSTRYDRHWGYYADVKSAPKRALVVSVSWTEAKQTHSFTETVEFDCSGCANGGQR